MGRFSRRAFLTSAVLALNANASGPGPLFEEVPATSSGISWKHDNATSAQHYMPEAIGPGCAFLDYDNDGWMDIFLVNSGPSAFWNPKTAVRNALYKNNRDGTFTDVTLKAGIAGNFFGMGAAVGDYDNDGWPDLLVTGYERVALYKNNHNGTFSDVTAKAGLAKLPSNWPTSAVWFDYDNDGRLDLFLCNYIEYPPGSFKQCGDNRIGRNYYCVPRVFNGAASMLFRNNGDGTFTCTSAGTSIEKAKGKALGVVATDVNNDGRMDLFVANDTVANFLFLNRGSGKDGKWNWEETGLASEVGYGENGQARSGMGADSADFDQDGLMDLFVSNIDQEMYSMYRNNGDETFTDVAHQYGIAQSTRTLSGWGLKFFDYDNDGDLDLILANAHPDDMIEMYSEQIKYKMPALLFHQENGKLRNVSSEAGPAFAKPLSSRGLAIGDFNNDGRPDVLIACNGASPVLLKNNSGAGNHWLGVHLRGTSCNADAIGTRIIWQVGTRKRSRLKTGGGSYLSSHDPREILGLGSSATVDSLEIKWAPPSTRVDRFSAIPADRYIRIEEGRGVAGL